MQKDLWLPKGHKIADDLHAGSLLYSGADWQIYCALGAYNILLVHSYLADKWDEHGFIDKALFVEVRFGDKHYFALKSHHNYALVPVAEAEPPETKAHGLSFACALRESRKLSKEVSFHDAIYMEQYSRLLPTWTLTPYVEDEVVLGRWITGGVEISTDCFRRLTSLKGWMSPADIADIVKASGLNVSANAGLTTKNTHVDLLDTRKTKGVRSDSESLAKHSKHGLSKKFSLPGRPQLEKFFNEHIIDIIFFPEKYNAVGIEFPSAVVLHGPPGCGKTFAVEKLIEFIDWPSYSIDSKSVGSPYIHETSRKISEVFEKAMDNAPSVVIIDEMESFLSDRQLAGSSALHRVEEVSEFLKRIPEAINNRVLIFAMTNLIELIDPALLRQGRFDHVIEVGMPTKIEVTSLLDSLLNKLPLDENLETESVLDALTGRPLSDAAFVIREAARLSAKHGKNLIEQQSLDMALKSLPDIDDRKGIGFALKIKQR